MVKSPNIRHTGYMQRPRRNLRISAFHLLFIVFILVGGGFLFSLVYERGQAFVRTEANLTTMLSVYEARLSQLEMEMQGLFEKEKAYRTHRDEGYQEFSSTALVESPVQVLAFFSEQDPKRNWISVRSKSRWSSVSLKWLIERLPRLENLNPRIDLVKVAQEDFFSYTKKVVAKKNSYTLMALVPKAFFSSWMNYNNSPRNHFLTTESGDILSHARYSYAGLRVKNDFIKELGRVKPIRRIDKGSFFSQKVNGALALGSSNIYLVSSFRVPVLVRLFQFIFFGTGVYLFLLYFLKSFSLNFSFQEQGQISPSSIPEKKQSELQMKSESKNFISTDPSLRNKELTFSDSHKMKSKNSLPHDGVCQNSYQPLNRKAEAHVPSSTKPISHLRKKTSELNKNQDWVQELQALIDNLDNQA